MWWPEACLILVGWPPFLGGRMVDWVAAPSCVKCKRGCCDLMGYPSFLFIGHAAGTEAIEVGGGGSIGRRRAQMGDNSRIEWGGTKTSR